MPTVMPLALRSPTLRQVLRLEVPIVVRLGDRKMRVNDVVRLVPGSIIELQKSAEAELDLLCNDRQIGNGTAVKVGENFGIRLTFIGDANDRLAAALAERSKPSAEDEAAANLAEQLLSSQNS